MKRINKCILFIVIFFVGIITVNAKTLNIDSDIPTNSYLIGTHVFTSDTVLTMEKIMYASKTIQSDELDDMIIYYKNPWGRWSNAVTDKIVDVDDTVNVTHINLEKLLGDLTIKYNANGGTGNMATQVIGGGKTRALLGNQFENSNKVFVNWNTASDGTGTPYTNTQLITSNYDDDITITLYAQWSIAYGDIFGDGVIDEKDLSKLLGYLEGAIQLNELELSTADINGDGEVNQKDYYILNKIISDNIETHFEQFDYQFSSFTVSFGGYGQSQTVTEATKVTRPSDPIREGYRFDGWYNGDKLFDFDTLVSSSLELTARWSIITYTITYILNDGIASNVTNYTIETDTFTLNQPIKGQLEFQGWTGSNGIVPQKVVTIEKGSTGDRTYTANWEKVYTVEVHLVDPHVIDTAPNSARELIVKCNGNVVEDAQAIKTLDGFLIDDSNPFSIDNWTLGEIDSVIVVLNDGTEVTATVIK